MNTSGKLLTAFFLLPFAVLAAVKSEAATQGTLGATSTGTLDVTMTIPSLFRISGLDGLTLGAYTPHSGDMSGGDDVCVYTNQANGDYRVTITDNSSMTPGKFAVENSTHTGQIPLDVRWNSRPGTAGGVLVTYGASLPASGANTRATDCSVGGLSANLQVKLHESDLLPASAGLYSSRLLVEIGP